MNHNQTLIHLAEVYPNQKRQLFKNFKHQPVALEVFVSAVDKSDHPLSDWLDALDIMAEWLSKKGRVMSLNDKIQYLNCATEIIAQGSHWDNLCGAIYALLEEYGCERSSDQR